MSFPLIPPLLGFYNSSGSPLVSGTIEFRDPTTNNLINTFPTADDADAQTNANANPLTLNSRGEAASGIFLEDGVVYKVILKDLNGDTVWTIDDVRCPIYSAESIGKTLYAQTTDESNAGVTPSNFQFSEEYIQVKRYGAVADGTQGNAAADTAAAKAALLVAREHSGAKLVFEHGNFVIDEPLVPDSNKLEIIGDGATLTAGTGIPAGGAIINSMADDGGGVNQGILDAVYGTNVVLVRSNITGGLTWCKIRGFRFQPNANIGKAIWMTGFGGSGVIEDNFFNGFQDSCVVLNGSFSFTVRNNDMRGSSANGIALDLARPGAGVFGGIENCNAISILSNHLGQGGAQCFRWAAGLGGAIIGNIMESGVIQGAEIQGAQGFLYTGNYHEIQGAGNVGLILGIDGTTRVQNCSVTGNHFQMSTGSDGAILLNGLLRSYIDYNMLAGPVAVRYVTPASYTATQVVGNHFGAINDTAEIDESAGATLDRVANRLQLYGLVAAADLNEMQFAVVRVRSHLRLEELTPAQIVANQDDYAPGDASCWRLSSDASRTITGISQVNRKSLRLYNVGSQNIVLSDQDVGSSASNRFLFKGGLDLTLAANDHVDLWYDPTSTRWRASSTSGTYA